MFPSLCQCLRQRLPALSFCDRIPLVPPVRPARSRAATLREAGEMLDSIAVPLQAMFWPLAGAAIILVLSRILPNWLRRLVAAAATLASLSALWSLHTAGVERMALFWEPVNLFRQSPTLHADSLSLLAGLILVGSTAAVVLGIRGSEPTKTIWHALILIALVGCLITTMAGNLLTLVLGSAWIDLVLIAITASSKGDAGRVAWRMAVPGILSTLVLLLSTVQMSTQLGTVTLLARDFPTGILILMGIAGILRLMVFPLHPRGLNTPENAATYILLAGTGIYLLARTQALASVLVEQSWMLALGGLALLIGGFLAWTGNPSSITLAKSWPGMAIHQTGFALVFVLVLEGVTPWSLLGLSLALGILAIWWDNNLEREPGPRPRWVEWSLQRLESWWARAESSEAALSSVLARWRASWVGRHWTGLLPAVALVSLVGAPFTVGARGRWPFYAVLLKEGESLTLLVALVADALLATGLWTALTLILTHKKGRRPKPAALLAMFVLVIVLIALGIAPNTLNEHLHLAPVRAPDVSVWGLGFIYLLPWLLGAWLARVGAPARRYLDLARPFVSLDWLFQAAGWVGHRLVGAIGWLGRVGEGEGWLGWALIILALGVIFLTAR